MNVRPFLVVSALCVVAPAASQAAPDAALSRSLQARIARTEARLNPDGYGYQGGASLALALAQAGDASGAARLATTRSERDAIAQWRTEQRAMRGDFSGALQAASLIADDTIRADGFLVVTRLSLQNRDNAGARVALNEAMRALSNSSSASQISYAAWLHWKLGDVGAAKRILIDKAWPAAGREDEDRNKTFGIKREATEKIGPFSQKYTVAKFAARSGLLADLLQKVDGENSFDVGRLADGAQTAGDLNFLFARAMRQKDTDIDSLYTLAVNMASLGYDSQARQLRERARAQKSRLAPAEQTGFPVFLELLLAHQLNDAEAIAQITGDWDELSRSKDAPSDVLIIPQMLRVFEVENSSVDSPWRLRGDATPAAIDEFAAQWMKLPALGMNSEFLQSLISYYAPKDKEKTNELAQFIVQRIGDNAAQIKAKKGGSSGWNVSDTQIAAQLRRVGYEKEAQDIVNALVQKTPDNFRPFQAIELMKAGFPAAARQTFDPLQRLKSDQALQAQIKAATDPKRRETLQRQQNSFDWGDYAENEARYASPNAPALWIDALEKPSLRADALRGWAKGLWPQLDLAQPYFKITISADNGVSSGGSY